MRGALEPHVHGLCAAAAACRVARSYAGAAPTGSVPSGSHRLVVVGDHGTACSGPLEDHRAVPPVEPGRPCAPRPGIRSPPSRTARLPRSGGRPAAFSGARQVTVQRARAVQPVRVLYDSTAAPEQALVAGGTSVGAGEAVLPAGGAGEIAGRRLPLTGGQWPPHAPPLSGALDP